MVSSFFSLCKFQALFAGFTGNEKKPTRAKNTSWSKRKQHSNENLFAETHGGPCISQTSQYVRPSGSLVRRTCALAHRLLPASSTSPQQSCTVHDNKFLLDIPPGEVTWVRYGTKGLEDPSRLRGQVRHKTFNVLMDEKHTVSHCISFCDNTTVLKTCCVVSPRSYDKGVVSPTRKAVPLDSVPRKKSRGTKTSEHACTMVHSDDQLSYSRNHPADMIQNPELHTRYRRLESHRNKSSRVTFPAEMFQQRYETSGDTKKDRVVDTWVDIETRHDTLFKLLTCTDISTLTARIDSNVRNPDLNLSVKKFWEEIYAREDEHYVHISKCPHIWFTVSHQGKPSSGQTQKAMHLQRHIYEPLSDYYVKLFQEECVAGHVENTSCSFQWKHPHLMWSHDPVCRAFSKTCYVIGDTNHYHSDCGQNNHQCVSKSILDHLCGYSNDLSGHNDVRCHPGTSLSRVDVSTSASTTVSSAQSLFDENEDHISNRIRFYTCDSPEDTHKSKPVLRESVRESVVQWMNKVTLTMKWKRSTFFIAVHALDTYLAYVSLGLWEFRDAVPKLNKDLSSRVEEFLPLVSTAALFLGVVSEEEHTQAHRIKAFLREVPMLTSVRQVYMQLLDMLTCMRPGLLVTRTPEDFIYYYLANLKKNATLLERKDRDTLVQLYTTLTSDTTPVTLALLIEWTLLVSTYMYENGIYMIYRGSHIVTSCMTPVLFFIHNTSCCSFCVDFSLLSQLALHIFQFPSCHVLLDILKRFIYVLHRLTLELIQSGYQSLEGFSVILTRFILSFRHYTASHVSSKQAPT